MFLLGDMLARFHTASLVHKSSVKVIYSTFCLAVIIVLRDLGYISFFQIEDKYIIVSLKYFQKKSVFKSLKLISRPGRRIFMTVNNLKSLNKKSAGFVICSTNKGILTSLECVKFGCGGEALFHIW